MTAEQLAEWEAYFELEPWGEDRADLRGGILAAVTANAFRSGKGRPFKPADFMPRFDGERVPAQQSQAQIAASFQAWAAAFGAKMG